MNNLSPLEKIRRDGAPINPNPQPLTPRHQDTNTAAREALARINPPKTEHLNIEMTDLRCKAPLLQTLEIRERETSEKVAKNDRLIEEFQETLAGNGPNKMKEFTSLAIDLVLAGLNMRQHRQLLEIQAKALADAAQHGDNRKALHSLIRFSPVGLTSVLLKQTLERASVYGHLREIYNAYLYAVEDLSEELSTDDITEILSALNHPLVPSGIQKMAITKAIDAGLLNDEEEDSLSSILKALEGFETTVLVDSIGKALLKAKSDKSTGNEKYLLLSATFEELTKPSN